MIDTAIERPIDFNAAGAALPEGNRPAYSTWWRWYTRGIRGVRLETVVIGGRRYTTAEAVQRFIAATTAAADGTPVPSVTPRERAANLRRANRELAAEGFFKRSLPINSARVGARGRSFENVAAPRPPSAVR